MKITTTNWRGSRELSLAQAITDACTPDAYSYDGALERLKAENDKLRDVLKNLIETIYGDKQYIRPEQKLSYILGYGFKVENADDK